MPSLITGASGFLGGRLAQMLVEQGEEVVVLARPTSDLRHLAGLPIRIVQGDLNDPASLREAVRGATRIFHCAACSTDWAPWQTYFEANVTGTRNLLAAAAECASLQRFVHVSSTDVYGYPAVPCEESHPLVDAGLPYNQTKRLGELAVWDRVAELPVTIVRPATIYGPRGKDFTVEIAALMRQRLMATIDGGRAPGGFTYVDNVAGAMIEASRSPRTLGEAYNLSDGSNATWLDYIRLFAAALGCKMPWIDLSLENATRLARVLEVPHRVLRLPGRPLLTRHAVVLLGLDQEFPIAKARRDFGFVAGIGVEEGVVRSAAWVRGGQGGLAGAR